MNTLKEINEHHKDIQKLNAQCYQQLANLRDKRKELISINKRICKDCAFWVVEKEYTLKYSPQEIQEKLNRGDFIIGGCNKDTIAKIKKLKSESNEFCGEFESRYLVFDWLAESRRLFKQK